jgi:hypothetical protein
MTAWGCVSELQRDGVEILARGSFGMGIRDGLIAARGTDRRR